MTHDDSTQRPETRGGYLSGGLPLPATLGDAHARIRDLERLCAEVYVAAVELGLPDPLLQKLWRVAAGGHVPQAFLADLPDLPPRARSAPSPGDGPPHGVAEAVAGSRPDIGGPPPPSGDPEGRPGPLSRLWQTVWRRPARRSEPPAAGLPTHAAEGQRHSPPELRPLAQRYTVLVADDDPAMLQLLTKILRRENFEIITANDGVEALAKAEALGPALALLVTDYDMPGLTGRQLADRVRASHPKVKVLFQTGFSDALFGHEADLGDSAAFLEKPFSARGLREAARLILFDTLNP